MPYELFTLDHFAAYTRNLVLDTGDYWDLEDFQAEIAESVLEPIRRLVSGERQTQAEVWIVIPEGNAKHLAVDTPLPTPDGWTTMLDVRVGDHVLNAEGLPTRVAYVSPISFDEDCWRVTFSDGAQIVSSGVHLWRVEDAVDHYTPVVRSTRYMGNRPLTMSKGGRSGLSEVARWRVQTACRRVGPDVVLPIDPYVLGVWLGDGTTRAGTVTNVDDWVWGRVAAAGYELGVMPSSAGKARTQTVLGLSRQLREAGLLGRKHIPESYLVAPEEDRWQLLQGLMDTDGTVSKAGQATFCTTLKRLADEVQRLVWSLGLPCFVNEGRVDYGVSYKLTVACDQRHPVVSLPRKAERLKARGLTCDHRRIVAVDRVATVPVRCIEVEAADRLYLAGEAMVPTHNTTLMAGLGLYVADFAPLPCIPVGASTRDQAEILAHQAYQMIRMSPGMLKRFRIYAGYRRIQPIRKDHPQPGRRGIVITAADQATGDGMIPSPMSICDEGHRHRDMQLYQLWTGKLIKRGGVSVMISTAGVPGHGFEMLRDEIRRKATEAGGTQRRDGAHLVSRSPGGRVTMHEWQLQDQRWASDMSKVKEANPLAAITESQLQEQFDSPTTNRGLWLRLKPLAVDTPLPTPDGWTTMGEVQVGDRVLGSDGMPVRVSAVTPVVREECFRLRFSDGAEVIASGDHSWAVEDVYGGRRPSVKTTTELAAGVSLVDGRGRSYARWQVATAGRAVGSGELPVDPYVLGAWLGDGDCRTGRITNVDPGVWDQIQARGYELSGNPPNGHPSRNLYGLLPKLRALGLLAAKCIPDAYLTAAPAARWALMQGLIDTDGSISKSGRVKYYGSSRILVEDVQRLAWSLGLTASLTTWRVRGGRGDGMTWGLEMACDARHPVALLPRKVDRLQPAGRKIVGRRRLRSVESVGLREVRCIGVDCADHLFLAGEAFVPTHNCNVPARATNAAVSAAEWDDRQVMAQIPKGFHVGLGVDVAWLHDTFAIVPQAKLRDYRLYDKPTILRTPRDGTMLHPDFVKTAFDRFLTDFVVDVVVMDVSRGEEIAAWLEDQGIHVVLWPQGNSQAARDYEGFMSDLRTGAIRHTGDEEFRQHVLNAVARPLPGDKWRFDRPTSSRSRAHDDERQIDALAAASFINSYSRDVLDVDVEDYRVSLIG